jgi:hypothetical protein
MLVLVGWIKVRKFLSVCFFSTFHLFYLHCPNRVEVLEFMTKREACQVIPWVGQPVEDMVEQLAWE